MTVMNARRTALRSAATAAVLALGAVPLTGCGTGPAGADDGRTDVVVSFYPLRFLAEQIGGRHVEVTTLTAPGAEPHDLELTPRQVGELGEADLVVYLRGLQPAVDEAVGQSDVAHVADVAALAPAEEQGGGHEHGEHEGHDHGGHEHGEHGDEGRTVPGHEGHDHGTGPDDPHLWLDPVRFATAAEGVGDRLAEADPAHRAAYEKNTARLVERLHALDQDFADGLKNRSTDTFLTTHAAFGQLAGRYGLHEESITGIDPESGAVSGSRLRELHKVAEEDRVTTVFAERGADRQPARTLAGDLGLRTGVLDTLETAGEGRDDYFSLMRRNLASLRTALGAR
jgi:ABC-type Zn uptake system ZnuABC Zn-binding protein ZnuA